MKDYIEIIYARITRPIPEDLYQSYLALLPKDLQETNQRFIRWQDRHLNLIGKIMLRSVLLDLGAGADALQDLKYNDWDKPLLDHLNFNISHAGEFVVCACTRMATSVGIDIERKRSVSFDDFLNTMNENQWAEINRDSGNALNLFYSYWVRKESVIKAEGRGLSMPLSDISFSGEMAMVKGRSQSWHITELALHPDYAMALATEIAPARDSLRLSQFRIDHDGRC